MYCTAYRGESMLYFTADLPGQHWWSRAAWGYLAALDEAGVAFRSIWRATVADPIQRNLTPEAWHNVLDYHLGGDFSAEPDAVVFHGAMGDACRWIRTPGDIGERNIALVTWPDGALPDQYADGLRKFHGVIVPSWDCARVLKDAGVERVEVIPMPAQPLLYVPTAPNEDHTAFLAIGQWAGEGNVEDIVDAYVDAFKPSASVRLCLICPDAPFQDERSLRRVLMVDEFPPISCHALALDVHYAMLEKVFGVTDVYVSATTRADLDPFALDAAAANLDIIVPKQIQSWIDWYGVTYWESGENGGRLAAAMHAAVAAPRRGESRANAASHDLEEVGRNFIDAVSSLIQRAWVLSAEMEEDEVARCSPSVLFVIPFRNRPVEELEAAVKSILFDGGDVLVVDQGSDEEHTPPPRLFQDEEGVALLTPSPEHPSGEFWIARARNDGAAVAWDKGYDIVAFVDADITVPPGYVEAVRQRVRRGIYLVPSCDDRPATGCAAIWVEDLYDVGGYDHETFHGWGSEDIDLLMRLDRHGCARLTDVDGCNLNHAPHGVGADCAEQGKRNLAILGNLDVGRRVKCLAR
jgi:hypothetical protein